MLSGMGEIQLSDTHLRGDLFPICYRWVHIAEGGDSDHEADKGGFTRSGLSLGFLKNLPLNKIDLDSDGDIDRDDALLIDKQKTEEIYREYFWEAYHCDKLSFIPAICLFDAVINHRPRAAVKLLQSSIGAKADGVIGPATIKAACSLSNPEHFLADHLSRRGLFYHDIVTANSTQSVFLRGWLARLIKLQQFIYNEVKQ